MIQVRIEVANRVFAECVCGGCGGMLHTKEGKNRDYVGFVCENCGEGTTSYVYRDHWERNRQRVSEETKEFLENYASYFEEDNDGEDPGDADGEIRKLGYEDD